MPGSIPAGKTRRSHRRRPPPQRQKKRISPEPNRRRPVYFAARIFSLKKIRRRQSATPVLYLKSIRSLVHFALRYIRDGV
jgi:hypothetical protein